MEEKNIGSVSNDSIITEVRIYFFALINEKTINAKGSLS
jgi:hypothetical protein